MSRSPAYVETPAQAQVVSAEGPRPFVTHVRYRLADGRLLDWASRRHRKRPGTLGRRIAVLFMIGSACFVAGSMAGYAALVGASADAITYFVGSIFFTSAAYLQYVECISADRKALPEAGRRRRLLAIEVRRIDWWATSVQLLGTLFFNLTTFTALDAHLNAKQSDLVVWTPDALGSVCFLVASQLAYAEAGHAWVSWRPSDAGWRIAALNMLGSIFFGISAIAGWVQPSTGDLLDAALDTSGTFCAARFFIGAALLLRADTPPRAGGGLRLERRVDVVAQRQRQLGGGRDHPVGAGRRHHRDQRAHQIVHADAGRQGVLDDVHVGDLGPVQRDQRRQPGQRRLLGGQLRDVDVVLFILIDQREERPVPHGQHSQRVVMIHSPSIQPPIEQNPSSASDDRKQLVRHSPVLASILPLAMASVSAL